MRVDVSQYMPPGDVWRIWHNYVPKVEAVRRLDKMLVILLAERKYTKYFLRLVRQLPQNSELEHAVHTTALLALWFGERAAAFVKRTGLSVHDAGINLPAPNTDNGDEKQAFLWRYAHRINDATKVVASWNAIRQEMSELPGAPTPLSKGGIDLALELLKSYSYDGVRSKEFARVAAECGVSQSVWLIDNPTVA